MLSVGPRRRLRHVFSEELFDIPRLFLVERSLHLVELRPVRRVFDVVDRSVSGVVDGVTQALDARPVIVAPPADQIAINLRLRGDLAHFGAILQRRLARRLGIDFGFDGCPRSDRGGRTRQQSRRIPHVGTRSPLPDTQEYSGSRSALLRRPSCGWADPDSYLAGGRVLVARTEDEVLGHLQLLDTPQTGVSEIANLEVRTADQGRSLDARLVAAAIDLATATAGTRVVVAIAAADISNLRFYQQQGFRMASIERDAFTPENDRPSGTRIDGIEYRDRVWLDRDWTQLTRRRAMSSI